MKLNKIKPKFILKTNPRIGLIVLNFTANKIIKPKIGGLSLNSLNSNI